MSAAESATVTTPGAKRTAPLVEIRGVSHYFRGQARPAVAGVDLAVAEAEIVALVGESGCGKSTLGRIFAGYIEPTEGEIAFRGRGVRRMGRRERRDYQRQVQMVHQDPFASLNPSLTLRTTLGYAARYHGLVSRGDLDEFLLGLLGSVGLDASREFLDRYPHQLSGGQRQRVAIARAMSLKPSLIVADEAVSMLDVSMRVSLLDLMLGFRERDGVGYIFVSHDLGVVRYFASEGRVVVMFYGVVVEIGAVEEVIAHPRHPYTIALLRSLPVADPRRARRLRTGPSPSIAEGSDPTAGASTSGCVFRHRCPLARERCAEAPPLDRVGGGQLAACWFPEEAAELARAVA